MDIAKAILSLDRGIRAILWVDKETQEMKTVTREGLTTQDFIVPWGVWRQLGVVWVQVINGIAHRVSEYAGKAKRIVFHFEKFDLLMVSLPSGDFVITVDKNVHTDELARKIMEQVAE